MDKESTLRELRVINWGFFGWGLLRMGAKSIKRTTVQKPKMALAVLGFEQPRLRRRHLTSGLAAQWGDVGRFLCFRLVFTFVFQNVYVSYLLLFHICVSYLLLSACSGGCSALSANSITRSRLQRRSSLNRACQRRPGSVHRERVGSFRLLPAAPGISVNGGQGFPKRTQP